MAVTLSVAYPITGLACVGGYRRLRRSQTHHSDAAAKIRTEPEFTVLGSLRSNWLLSEPRRGPEAAPRVPRGLLLRIRSNVFRTGPYLQPLIFLGGFGTAGHSNQ